MRCFFVFFSSLLFSFPLLFVPLFFFFSDPLGFQEQGLTFDDVPERAGIRKDVEDELGGVFLLVHHERDGRDGRDWKRGI